MITVQWQPPQDNGSAPVVNYTITVPGLTTHTTTATSAVVTLPYNVMYTVSIVATNCNGSSSAVMKTIPSIGSNMYLQLMPHTLLFHSLASQPTSARKEGCGQLSIQVLSPAHWILCSNQRTVFSHVICCHPQHPFND